MRLHRVCLGAGEAALAGAAIAAAVGADRVALYAFVAGMALLTVALIAWLARSAAG